MIKIPFGWAVFGNKYVHNSNINQISMNYLSISSVEDLNSKHSKKLLENRHSNNKSFSCRWTVPE